jgi:hypothetical protein
MSRSAAATATMRQSSQAAQQPSPARGYFEETALPLPSLAFLLPMIAIYEIGIRWYASHPSSEGQQRILAFTKAQQFFSLFGATGQLMPAGAVIAILLCCHLVRRDSWSTHLGYIAGMFLESAMYAIPLRALALVFSGRLPLYAGSQHMGATLVLSVGAGVYEEMLFRFVAFTILSFLLIDLMRMEKVHGYVLIVVISALAFAAYHYWGAEQFEWRSFAFRTLAGIYFGTIFFWRGIGITAGAHAAYDISTFALQLLAVH